MNGRTGRRFWVLQKKADPEWEKMEKPILSGALDGITRESIEANMKKNR